MTLLDKEVFPGIRLSLLIPPPQRALFYLTFTLTLSLEGQGKARDREHIQRALSSALLRLATVLIDNWRHRLLQLLLQAYKSQLQHMLEFGPLIAYSAPSLAYLMVAYPLFVYWPSSAQSACVSYFHTRMNCKFEELDLQPVLILTQAKTILC